MQHLSQTDFPPILVLGRPGLPFWAHYDVYRVCAELLGSGRRQIPFGHFRVCELLKDDTVKLHQLTVLQSGLRPCSHLSVQHLVRSR